MIHNDHRDKNSRRRLREYFKIRKGVYIKDKKVLIPQQIKYQPQIAKELLDDDIFNEHAHKPEFLQVASGVFSEAPLIIELGRLDYGDGYVSYRPYEDMQVVEPHLERGLGFLPSQREAMERRFDAALADPVYQSQYGPATQPPLVNSNDIKTNPYWTHLNALNIENCVPTPCF